MTSSNKFGRGILILLFGLGITGFAWPSSAMAEETSVSLPIEKVADYLYAMIEADREVYTKHVVERMQTKGGSWPRRTGRRRIRCLSRLNS